MPGEQEGGGRHDPFVLLYTEQQYTFATGTTPLGTEPVDGVVKLSPSGFQMSALEMTQTVMELLSFLGENINFVFYPNRDINYSFVRKCSNFQEVFLM